MEIAPETLGADAAAVFVVDEYLPNYFEIAATINSGKPIKGLKSNAYLIFDYQGENDFKFAGVNISTDKIEMGYRDASGWHVVSQTPSQLRYNTDYQLLLAINGTNATLVVNNKDAFSYTFDPRVDEDGFIYGLNDGMVGLGSNNSVARIDDVRVQVLPPELTLEVTDDFSDGVADLFTGTQVGSWTFESKGNNYSYVPTVDADRGYATSATSLLIDSAYLLRVDTTLQTDGLAGVVFDQYGPGEYKFAGIDADSGDVVIAHHTARDGWVIDAAFAMGISAGIEYDLTVTADGSTVSVLLNGMSALSHAFNSVAVDGEFGLFSNDNNTAFASVTLATDDPAHLPVDDGNNLLAAAMPENEVDIRLPLNMYQLTPVLEAAIADWRESGLINDDQLADLDTLDVVIRDLPGLVLGRYDNGTLYLDSEAAGFGWYIGQSETPDGALDLITVVEHELGHALGFEHEDQGLMSATLSDGTRVSLTAAPQAVATTDAEQVVSAADEPVLTASSMEHVSLLPEGLYLTSPANETIRFATPTIVHADKTASKVETLYFNSDSGGLSSSMNKSVGVHGSATGESLQASDTGRQAADHSFDDWLIQDSNELTALASDNGLPRTDNPTKHSVNWQIQQDDLSKAAVLPGLMGMLRQVARPVRNWWR